MKSMAKWMLGAAVVAGGLGLAATPAKAAEWGVYIGGPAAYVPPCPGPGYEWTAGYYSGGYWVPGSWNYVGAGYYGGGPGYGAYYGDRDDDHWRGWGHDRRDWDGDRGGWGHERGDWGRGYREHDHWRR